MEGFLWIKENDKRWVYTKGRDLYPATLTQQLGKLDLHQDLVWVARIAGALVQMMGLNSSVIASMMLVVVCAVSHHQLVLGLPASNFEMVSVPRCPRFKTTPGKKLPIPCCVCVRAQVHRARKCHDAL